MKIGPLYLITMMLCAVGCTSETRTYSISVKNGLQAPVSICVTKANSADEPGWEAPENLILPPRPATDQTPPGKVVPPGKTLSIDQLTGRFDRDRGRAFLRIYSGTPNLTQMNAISAGSINRLDIPLNKGANRMVIVPGDEGSMKVIALPTPQPGAP